MRLFLNLNVPENTFEKAINIEDINFNNNPLESLQPQAFLGASALEKTCFRKKFGQNNR